MEAVVKLLLETGKVEMDSKDSKHGRTPLSWAAGSWAAQNGREAVVKLLLETSKVDVDSKDSEYGRTLLSWAALTGYEGVCASREGAADPHPCEVANSVGMAKVAGLRLAHLPRLRLPRLRTATHLTATVTL
jgi:hypothetical protein